MHVLSILFHGALAFGVVRSQANDPRWWARLFQAVMLVAAVAVFGGIFAPLLAAEPGRMDQWQDCALAAGLGGLAGLLSRRYNDSCM